MDKTPGRICVNLNYLSMVNHSDNPTVRPHDLPGTPVQSVGTALRDIEKGEEITEDYRCYYPAPAYKNLCLRFGVREVYEEDDYIKWLHAKLSNLTLD